MLIYPELSLLYYAIPCGFIHAIARMFCSRVYVFGGKEKTGDGTPEGLPLICRFSPG
jgi:hypothetical protein